MAEPRPSMEDSVPGWRFFGWYKSGVGLTKEEDHLPHDVHLPISDGFEEKSLPLGGVARKNLIQETETNNKNKNNIGNSLEIKVGSNHRSWIKKTRFHFIWWNHFHNHHHHHYSCCLSNYSISNWGQPSYHCSVSSFHSIQEESNFGRAACFI